MTQEQIPVFWDKNYSNEQARRMLKSESDPRFVDVAAALLSRTNASRVVFSRFLTKAAFCGNWRRIKRKMRENKWNDDKILFWEAIYEVVREDLAKKHVVFPNEKRESLVDPELKQIAETIRLRRKTSGLSQADLSMKTGLSQQAISFAENGYANISIKTLKKLASALKLEFKLVELTPPEK